MATLEELRRKQMQEQYNQPVYGPRNPPPAQPVQDTRPVIAQGDIGSALYGLGRAITSPQSTDQNPMMRSRFGVAPSAPAAPAVQQQPSIAAVAPSPAQPPMDPQVAAARAARDSRRAADAAELSANQPVLAQDRANLRAAVRPELVGPEPDRDAPMPSTAPAPIAGERGNYNLANTSRVDSQGRITSTLRQPDNIIEGGYGQFGGGRAAQFLAGQPSGGFNVAGEEVLLRSQLTSDNPQERRAAREQMAARQALALDAGATQRTGMQLEGEQIRASLAGEAAVQAAQAQSAGRQQEADIAGRYGLREANIRAQGDVSAAELTAGSGSNLLSRVRAEQEARRLAVAQEAFERGDTAAGERALGIPQPAQRRLTVDMTGNVIAVDGLPVSAEEAAAFKQAQGYYAAPMQ